MFNIFKKIFHILNSISVSAPGYILFLSMGDFIIWKIEKKKEKNVQHTLLVIEKNRLCTGIFKCCYLLFFFQKKNVVMETTYASILLAWYNDFNKIWIGLI